MPALGSCSVVSQPHAVDCRSYEEALKGTGWGRRRGWFRDQLDQCATVSQASRRGNFDRKSPREPCKQSNGGWRPIDSLSND